MSKKTRNRSQQCPASKEQQQRAEARQKKEFIKGMMKADRLVVFSGGNQINHWGMPGNGDFLLFLLQEVYGWDGTNGTFQRILGKITSRSQQQAASPEEAELDSIMSELDQEDEGAEQDNTVEDGDDGDNDHKSPKNGEGRNVLPRKEAELLKSEKEKKSEKSDFQKKKAALLSQLAALENSNEEEDQPSE